MTDFISEEFIFKVLEEKTKFVETFQDKPYVILGETVAVLQSVTKFLEAFERKLQSSDPFISKVQVAENEERLEQLSRLRWPLLIMAMDGVASGLETNRPILASDMVTLIQITDWDNAMIQANFEIMAAAASRLNRHDVKGAYDIGEAIALRTPAESARQQRGLRLMRPYLIDMAGNDPVAYGYAMDKFSESGVLDAFVEREVRELGQIHTLRRKMANTPCMYRMMRKLKIEPDLKTIASGVEKSRRLAYRVGKNQLQRPGL